MDSRDRLLRRLRPYISGDDAMLTRDQFLIVVADRIRQDLAHPRPRIVDTRKPHTEHQHAQLPAEREQPPAFGQWRVCATCGADVEWSGVRWRDKGNRAMCGASYGGGRHNVD